MSYAYGVLVDTVELVDIPTTKWGSCKSVLRSIANHANPKEADLAWPGIELMMLETGFSESVITRTTAVLAQYGWITKKRRSGASNLYRVNMAKIREHQAASSAPEAVYMGKHLDGMAFEGENLEDIKGYKKSVSKRSTARKRAQKAQNQAADQPTRQIDGKEPSNRREGTVKSTGRNRQIDDLSSNELVEKLVINSIEAHAREATADPWSAEEDRPIEDSSPQPKKRKKKSSASSYEFIGSLPWGDKRFGSHALPSVDDADDLAVCVDQALAQGHQLADLRRHCEKALARSVADSAVPYLENALTRYLPMLRPAQTATPEIDYDDASMGYNAPTSTNAIEVESPEQVQARLAAEELRRQEQEAQQKAEREAADAMRQQVMAEVRAKRGTRSPEPSKSRRRSKISA